MLASREQNNVGIERHTQGKHERRGQRVMMWAVRGRHIYLAQQAEVLYGPDTRPEYTKYFDFALEWCYFLASIDLLCPFLYFSPPCL